MRPARLIFLHLMLILGLHIPLYWRLPEDSDLSLKRVAECKFKCNLRIYFVHILVHKKD